MELVLVNKSSTGVLVKLRLESLEDGKYFERMDDIFAPTWTSAEPPAAIGPRKTAVYHWRPCGQPGYYLPAPGTIYRLVAYSPFQEKDLATSATFTIRQSKMAVVSVSGKGSRISLRLINLTHQPLRLKFGLDEQVRNETVSIGLLSTRGSNPEMFLVPPERLISFELRTPKKYAYGRVARGQVQVSFLDARTGATVHPPAPL